MSESLAHGLSVRFLPFRELTPRTSDRQAPGVGLTPFPPAPAGVPLAPTPPFLGAGAGKDSSRCARNKFRVFKCKSLRSRQRGRGSPPPDPHSTLSPGGQPTSWSLGPSLAFLAPGGAPARGFAALNSPWELRRSLPGAQAPYGGFPPHPRKLPPDSLRESIGNVGKQQLGYDAFLSSKIPSACGRPHGLQASEGGGPRAPGDSRAPSQRSPTGDG